MDDKVVTYLIVVVVMMVGGMLFHLYYIFKQIQFVLVAARLYMRERLPSIRVIHPMSCSSNAIGSNQLREGYFKT